MDVHGIVTNLSGNTMIGYGRSAGTYVQNGGETYLKQEKGWGLVPVVVVGMRGGIGRLVVTNGVFTSKAGTVFVGGCPEEDIPVFDNQIHNKLLWEPESVPVNGHDAEGTVTVVDGVFQSGSNVCVGVDGTGTIEMIGSGGTFTAKHLVMSNATSSVARFVADADGFSPITVTESLTVTDGMSVQVDLSDYERTGATFRLFDFGSFSGNLDDVYIEVVKDGETVRKPCRLRKGDASIDMVIISGTAIYFR